MNAVTRRKEIMLQLEQTGVVSVNELAEHFEVSPMTIRRDLAFFEKQGILFTNYGGAHLAEGNNVIPDYSSRSSSMMDYKRRIGEKAATYINEGDTIFLDTGTTIYQMAKHFPDVHATIITNSLSVLQLLGGNAKLTVIMAPGTYRQDTCGVLNSDTISFLQKFHVNKAFLSALGCSKLGGLSTMEEIDSKTKRIMWENSDQSFLLIDYTKFNHQYLIQYNELSDFNYVLTNAEVEKDQEVQIRQMCKHLVIC